MLKKLGQWFGEHHLYPGDTVSIVYDDVLEGDDVLIKSEVKKEMHITTARIYEFEDEFELKEGYAGIIGNDDE